MLVGPWSLESTKGEKGGLVRQWAGTHWTQLSDDDGEALAKKWISETNLELLTADKVKSAWKLAKMTLRLERPMPATPEDDVLIPTMTHTLKMLPGGEIHAVPPAPEFGLTHVLDARFDELPLDQETVYEPCPPQSSGTFASWLAAVQPDPAMQSLVQELCGMTLLTKAYSIAGWFVGDAGSGKSTMLELVALVHPCATRMRLDKLDGDFSLTPLLDASVALVDEVTPKGLCEETLKSLISQNSQRIDRKHTSSVAQYRPKAKWLICANQMPRVHDASEGLWRRLIFVPWDHVVPEKGRIADVHKQCDLREVIDWMLVGAARILKRGRLPADDELPEACQRMKRMAQLSSDSVADWIDGRGARIDFEAPPTPCKVIYADYVAFLEERGEPTNRNAFWRGIRDRFRSKGMPEKTLNRRIDGKQFECYPIVWDAIVAANAPAQGGVMAAPALTKQPGYLAQFRLHEAAAQLDLEKVSTAVKAGCLVDVEEGGKTALAVAMGATGERSQKVAVAAVLILAGAQAFKAMNGADPDHQDILMEAMGQANDMSRPAPAPAPAPTTKSGGYVDQTHDIHAACERVDVGAIRRAIEAGANPDLMRDGRPPLATLLQAESDNGVAVLEAALELLRARANPMFALSHLDAEQKVFLFDAMEEHADEGNREATQGRVAVG